MTAVKIKIECEDTLMTAVIASAIARALEAEQFTNVKVKMLMVYQKASTSVEGSASPNFSKKAIVNELLGDVINHRSPSMYVHELIPARAGYIDTYPPTLKDTLLEQQVSALDSPILIDMGLEPPDYEEQENAFLHEMYFTSENDEDSARRRK